MIRILLTLVLLAPLAAQQPGVGAVGPSRPADAPDRIDDRNWERRLFKLQYADAPQVEQILRTFGVPIVANREFRTVAVRAPREIMPAMEDAIRKLDVAPPPVKNVDLVFYLLAAMKQPGGTVPADLQPVTKQISSIMAYQGFELLDTAILRTRAGGPGQVSGVLEAAKGRSYRIHFNPVDVTPGPRGNTIRLERLSIMFTGNNPGSGIETDLDFTEGQKAVIGKTSLEGPDRALIVVVTAKVVD
jgi:hypothetical protein